MSSGGMDWAYRTIAADDLDPLGVAVILHMGWRDAPSQLTDTGIARALHQHRSSVRLATAKLEQMGVICRAPAGFWIAVETVKTVQGAADAPRPDPASADDDARPLSGQRPVSGRGQSVATARPVSGHENGQSVATKRKEKYEKARAAVGAAKAGRSPRAEDDAASAPLGEDAGEVVAALSVWQRSCLRSDATLHLVGRSLKPSSREFQTLAAALAGREAAAREGQHALQGRSASGSAALAASGAGL